MRCSSSSVSGLVSVCCTGWLPQLAADRLRELGLRHLRATLDVLLLRLFVELLFGAALGAAVRPEATAPARRDVVRRRTALLLRLTGPGTFLVHRARRDLLGGVLAAATLFQAGL